MAGIGPGISRLQAEAEKGVSWVPMVLERQLLWPFGLLCSLCPEASTGAKPALGCPGVQGGLLAFDKVNFHRLSRVPGRVAEVDEA